MKRSLLTVGTLLAALVVFAVTAPASGARLQNDATGTASFSFVIPSTAPSEPTTPTKEDDMPDAAPTEKHAKVTEPDDTGDEKAAVLDPSPSAEPSEEPEKSDPPKKKPSPEPSTEPSTDPEPVKPADPTPEPSPSASVNPQPTETPSPIPTERGTE